MYKITFLILFFSTIVSSAHASAVIEAKKNNARQQQQIQQQIIQRQMQQQATQQVQKVEPVVEEVVDLKSIWKELEVSSEVWTLMIDNEPKLITVENYIALYAKRGVAIRMGSQFYVDLVDEMAVRNPEMLKSPFADVLRFIAIVEYDYDNGSNPDVLARELLSEEAYYSNRRRLGIE